ncbi:dTDP-4-dehydrorhamnose 3,5-epimerase family protein, partial [Pseudomonas sp. JH-2]|nr:dTDP-4-dehydrorhamnose 3,5-epimerase family protein [Pseudomonas sp. JH-2]
KTTDYYAPQHERCLAWNDAEVGVDWILERLDGIAPQLSAKDQVGKSFSDAECYD